MLQVYLTDLAAYNKGYLFGEWVSLPHSDIQGEINRILKAGETMCFVELGYYEEHEEHFITDDWWDDIEVFRISEYHNIYELNEEAELLFNLSHQELKITKFLLDNGFANSVADATTSLSNVIVHENSSMEDVAYSYIEECYDLSKIPSIIANNIDYERIARDMEIDGSYYEVDGDIYEYVA